MSERPGKEVSKKGLDNVDLDRVKDFEELIRKDPSRARKTQVIEGE